ncbi:hypothetical protein CB0940_10951 [Cercospora beticola]|uniref:Uncharacterized protein n=1 Tax=Cercospora beticola TaxID=122368 RepID=A0A2G5HCT7_CERBT|nr:hypothetical protein CB0940_10951 [Cercospora beticola]PIA90376.1 hypothetical protein CB0940_10951 [Cercospora beticola]WPB07702.1 hypothetical protein RHO25_012363 [Cercospora beticola]CAK1356490.1 unnamed protein product [Cercospora beticola]
MASNSNSNAMGRLFCAYNNVAMVKLSDAQEQELLQDLLDDAKIILKDPGTYTAATVLPLCEQLESTLEAYNASIDGPYTGTSSMPPPPAPLHRKAAAQPQPADDGDATTSSLGVVGGKEVIPPMSDDEIDSFLASATYKTLVPPCTTIIRAAEKGRWIELRCRTCGGNCTQAGHTPLRGLSSFSTHMQYFHGIPRASDAQTLKQCSFRNVEELEVRAILAMGTAGAPFVELVEVSKEKKMASAGKGTTEVVEMRKKGGGTKKVVVRQARDQDRDDYMGDVSSSTAPQASLTTTDDSTGRRSSRIADKKRAMEQADAQEPAARPAKRQRKSRMSDETAEYEVDRLWYDVEEMVYKTEQNVWLADLNGKAEEAGLLEGRAPMRM